MVARIKFTSQFFRGKAAQFLVFPTLREFHSRWANKHNIRYLFSVVLKEKISIDTYLFRILTLNILNQAVAPRLSPSML